MARISLSAGIEAGFPGGCFESTACKSGRLLNALRSPVAGTSGSPGYRDARVKVYTPGMTLKNAAFFAFIGMTLLTVVCAAGFIGDISALLTGAIAPMIILNSLIHLMASLSVAVFLYVFYKAQD